MAKKALFCYNTKKHTHHVFQQIFHVSVTVIGPAVTQANQHGRITRPVLADAGDIAGVLKSTARCWAS